MHAQHTQHESISMESTVRPHSLTHRITHRASCHLHSHPSTLPHHHSSSPRRVRLSHWPSNRDYPHRSTFWSPPEVEHAVKPCDVREWKLKRMWSIKYGALVEPLNEYSRLRHCDLVHTQDPRPCRLCNVSCCYRWWT